MLHKSCCILVGIVLIAFGASAKTCIWQVPYGLASEASNWDGGKPGASDDAVVTGGTMVVSSDLGIKSMTNDDGVVLVTGGTLDVGVMTLGATVDKTGGLVLQGGLLSAGKLTVGAGMGDLVLAGGTLRVAGAAANAGDVPGIRVSTLAGTTSVIDTNGKDVRIVQDVGQALDAAVLAHRWSFNGSLADSVGEQTASTFGSVSLGETGAQLNGLAGTEAGVSLGSVFDACTEMFTVEMWFKLTMAVSWKRMFYACNSDETSQFYIYPVRGSALDEWKPWAHTPTKDVNVSDKAGAFVKDQMYHVSIVGRHQASGWQLVCSKRDTNTGALLCRTVVNAPGDWHMSDMTNFTLGHATAGAADGGCNGFFDEVRVWKGALSDAELMLSARRGPDASIPGVGGGVAKSGDGALSLEGKNGYAGVTDVSDGSLMIGEVLRPSHRWTFDNGVVSLDYLKFVDDQGGEMATAEGNAAGSITSDADGVVLPGAGRASAYIKLGTGDAIFNGCENGLTFELWATRLDSSNLTWPRILSIFSPAREDGAVISMAWTWNTDTTRDIICAYYDGTKVQYADKLSPYVDGTEYHLAVSVCPGATDGTWEAMFYKQTANGQPIASYHLTMPTGWTPASLTNCTAYLGLSPAAGQHDAHARYSECRIWPRALTENELRRLGTAGKESIALVGLAAATDTTTANLKHRWSFNANWTDSVGGQTAVPHGSVVLDATGVTLPGGKTQTDYVSLGSVFGDCAEAFTIETWYRQNGAPGWTRPFTAHDGVAAANRFWYYSTRGTSAGELQVNAVSTSSGQSKFVNGINSALTIGQMFHVSVMGWKCDNGWQIVVNKRDVVTGDLISGIGLTPSTDWNPSLLTAFDLGYACCEATMDNCGYFDEVRVWNRVLTNAELTRSVLAGPDALPAFDRGLPAGTAVTVAVGAELHGEDVSVVSLAGAGSFHGSYVLGNGAVLDLADSMPTAFDALRFTGGATVKVAQATLFGIPVGRLSVSGRNTVAIVSGGEDLRSRETLFSYDTADIDTAAAWTVFGGQVNTCVWDDPANSQILLRSPKGLILIVQ